MKIGSPLLELTIKQQLLTGQPEVAKSIIPIVEEILIKTALQHTSG